MEMGPKPLGDDHLQSDLERVERLNYLADMLSELQELASREGCITLAGLLALSHVEALRQVPKSAEGP